MLDLCWYDFPSVKQAWFYVCYLSSQSFYLGCSADITPEVKRKNLSSKETQASIENKITVEDLTNPKGASEKYWEILAGKRQ